MSDLILLLFRVNLALAAAVLVVMALRLPVRRLFGARIAYGLWGLAPLAVAAMLAPARVVRILEAAPTAPAPTLVVLAPGLKIAQPLDLTFDLTPGPDPALILAGLWLAGVLVSLIHLAWRQRQFSRAVAQGTAGPAVVGVLRPRIVTPADFAQRYTPREQQVVLTHEAAHIARQDCRINALVALTRCLGWFNPLVHVMARRLRIDQELACDAAVVAIHPTARRSYAEAMLKAQLAARPLPLGCYWPSPAAHPLAERVRLLSRREPGPIVRRLGAASVAVLALAAAGAAWAARPAHVLHVPAAAPVAGPIFRPAHSNAVLIVRPAAAAVSARPAPAAKSSSQPVISADATEDPQGDISVPAAIAEAARALPFDPTNPGRRIHAVARRSAVTPGYAVRVLATMTDPDGIALTTDLTAYGSQSLWRTGSFWRAGSRYALFTSVVQQGDRFLVTASLDRRFAPETSGSILLASGQTGNIVLGNGQIVTVTPTLRPETPEETVVGRRAMGEV
jgi:beta-lactamase regulating signal transducer with metallopeptidase domain